MHTSVCLVTVCIRPMPKPDRQDEAPESDASLESDASPEDGASGDDASGDDASGDDASGDDISENGSGSEHPEDRRLTQTAKCPNCGRRFVGDYCPECGQEADPSTSATGVIGGFFREFVDLENGFWPTFVGLTFRPGEVLRDYLSGVRAGLISPGRYLLAAVVVGVAADQFLGWIGASAPPWAESEAPTSPNGTTSDAAGAAGGFDEAFETAVDQVGFLITGPQLRIAGVLLLTVLFAALLYRLFGDRLEKMGEALAVASFLTAHAIFLSTGAELLYVGAASLYAGQPAESPSFLNLTILFGYIGLASYRGFGPGWKSGLKGGFAGVWALVEVGSVLLAAGTLYACGLVLLYPGRYVPTGSTSSEELVEAVFVGLKVAIPLLLHVGVELYYRLR